MQTTVGHPHAAYWRNAPALRVKGSLTISDQLHPGPRLNVNSLMNCFPHLKRRNQFFVPRLSYDYGWQGNAGACLADVD